MSSGEISQKVVKVNKYKIIRCSTNYNEWKSFRCNICTQKQVHRPYIKLDMNRCTTFPTRLHELLAKTARVAESLLPAWRRFESLAVHSVSCEQSDQTLPTLVWLFAVCTYTVVEKVMPRHISYVTKVVSVTCELLIVAPSSLVPYSLGSLLICFFFVCLEPINRLSNRHADRPI